MAVGGRGGCGGSGLGGVFEGDLVEARDNTVDSVERRVRGVGEAGTELAVAEDVRSGLVVEDEARREVTRTRHGGHVAGWRLV